MCLFLQAAFCGQCGGLLFSVTAHSSHLALMCPPFCRRFSGDSVAAFYCKKISGWTQLILFIQTVFTNTNCLRPFIQAAIFLFKQVLNLSPAANKGIAASRAGRCYLRLRLAISFGFGRTSIFGLLFVIFYFYIFIHQRLWADIAMNSLPAAIPVPLPATLLDTPQ